MLQTLRNAWKIPELRKKIIFTLFILLIYRVGNVIPVPFIDVATLSNYFDSVLSTTILGLYNAMSGSAFSQATVFALGIQPYINASIIIQLLTIAIPALERLAKDGGEEGKKKIARISRYTTVGLGLLMGWAYYTMLRNYSSQGFSIVTEQGILPALVIILAFTAGSAVVMWLGEQITEFGIGNGISMILFANIVSGLPRMVSTLFTMPGMPEMMLANRIMEMPLPIPNSVICSPSHITRAEPAVKARMITTAGRKPVSWIMVKPEEL